MRLTDFSLTLGHRTDSLLLVTKDSEPIVTDATEIRVTRSAGGGFECEVTRPGPDRPVRSAAASASAGETLERANGRLRSVPVTADMPPVVCSEVSRIASALRDRMLDEEGDAELDRPDAEHTPTTLPRSIAAMPSTETSSPPATKSYFSSLSLDELRKQAKAADKLVVPNVVTTTSVVPAQAPPSVAEAESNFRGVAALFGCEDMVSPTESEEEIRKRIATEELRKFTGDSTPGRPEGEFAAHASENATRDLAACFEGVSGPATTETRDALFFPQPSPKATATRQFRRDVGRT